MIKKQTLLLKRIPIEGWIAIFISFAMAIIIFLRIEDNSDQVSLAHVIFWQLIIWAPIIVLSKRDLFITHYTFRGIQYIFYLVFLLLHLGWFAFISSSVSPYVGFTATRYGVYPFFFIFWMIIDITVIILLILYNKNIKLKMISSAKNNDENKVIEIKESGKINFVPTNEIIWLEADGYCSKIHTTHKQHHVRLSLKQLLNKLPSRDFIQVHRSSIINIHYLQAMQNSTNAVMKNGDVIKISRSGILRLKETLPAFTL